MTDRVMTVARDGATWPALVRHRIRQLRGNTFVWAFFIALMGLAVVSGWAEAYPEQAERDILAQTIQGNPAFQALFGQARGLETAPGFALWRATAFTSMLAAVWALLAAIRFTRAEEESGLAELLFAGAVTRRAVLGATLTALACGAGAIWAASVLGYSISDEMSLADSMVAAAPNAGMAMVFGTLGLAMAQVFGSARRARGVTTGLLFALLLARVVSGVEELSWLEWVTPVGWVNLVAAEDGVRLLPLALYFATALVFAVLAFALASGRQFQHSMIESDDTVRGAVRPVRSLAGVARLSMTPGVMSWGAIGGGLMFVMGIMTRDIMDVLEEAAGLIEMLERAGFPGLDRPEGFVGIAMTFAVLVVALYAASVVAGIRDEEAAERLETLLVRPVGRVRWLAGRAASGLLGIVAVAAISGLGAWLGTFVVGNPLTAQDVVLGTVNLVPAPALFLGIGVLGFAVIPRRAAAVAYGAILISYTLVFVAAFLEMPEWIVDVMPFTHVEAVPAVDPAWGAAAVMMAVGAACVALAIPLFRRRDLVGR